MRLCGSYRVVVGMVLGERAFGGSVAVGTRRSSRSMIVSMCEVWGKVGLCPCVDQGRGCGVVRGFGEAGLETRHVLNTCSTRAHITDNQLNDLMDFVQFCYTSADRNIKTQLFVLETLHFWVRVR